MKKLCRKGTVHPSPAVTKSDDDQFLSLLPVAILSLVAALSAEDREVLAYLISNSGDSSNRISRLKKTTKEDNNNHHSPLFLCDCFSCYTSYWVRWDTSPSRQLIHEIIDAYEDSLEVKKKKKKKDHRRSKRSSGKGSVRVDSVGTSRLSELGSSSTEFGGGDSAEEGNCGGGGEEAEKEEKGSVGKVLSFIGQKFLGVWG